MAGVEVAGVKAGPYRSGDGAVVLWGWGGVC